MEPSRHTRWTLAAAIAAVLLFALVFAAGGLAVRTVLADGFRNSENVRAARALLAQAIKQQLDEETGLRGFAATRDRLFLEPYYSGRSGLPETLRLLGQAVAKLQLAETDAGVRTIASANREWIATVAVPLLAGKTRNPFALEKRGKAILDRFRSETAALDDLLNRRRIALNRAMQSDIWRVGLFLFTAVVATLVLASVFVFQQFRLMTRLDDERFNAKRERERSIELRAAYQTEKRIADTLQNAFFQRPLPALPSLHLSATYTPAAEETNVGGDWYDVLEIPGDRVLFVIGDVAGHGIEAAVTMNHARQSLISSAVLATDPASILSLANADLFRQRASMVTAIAGFANYQTFEFVFAVAGHPPPLLVEPGRTPRMLGCGGLPLGVAAAGAYQTKCVQTVPGAIMVLYTDGAIEHSRDAIEGERLLIDAAIHATGTPNDSPATVIYDTIFSSRSVNDDVAILTIGFPLTRGQGLTISADGDSAASVDRLTVRGAAPAGSVQRARLKGWKTRTVLARKAS